MSHSIEQLIAIDLGNGTTSYIAGAGEIRGLLRHLLHLLNRTKAWVVASPVSLSRQSSDLSTSAMTAGKMVLPPVALTRAITVQKALRFCSSRS